MKIDILTPIVPVPRSFPAALRHFESFYGEAAMYVGDAAMSISPDVLRLC